ncbi:UDP-N-acetylmuramoyl-tripeptide--D-alanyl-D-alanine ligase [Lishizhenia tianjinensis]|uniref:UDP-N-acetylmuramoyl-tripeptide--D-alanyl-D-alanine ligase n=1 Tax=Lishizhenia tianjinensis TaxID=477690 RepID=A0A1I7AN13_9FLAO|nr:UDP-N-acetylmuramoyl-tripeptide--D-alanyl-D-alanine ligase [Lishizhenia tianjinensis]SFT76339.1 UDP-N-acetylmuramoyl-tripeptide--D-alanyl-D-alanine ligase [Lishizhenia tianjinensis]
MENLFELFYTCTGVSIDTRKLEKGVMYIALKGENFNGNNYAAQAIENGAKYAIVDEAEFANGKEIFYVENGLKFLQALATNHRRKMGIPVLGITGSNGKTTTKELVYTTLSQKYNAIATEGNLNNHIGVPLTLLKIKEQHEFAVVEMGANKPGDIQELCEIAEPNYGIISNIGRAHLEGFGSLQGVINTKTEMYRYIAKNRKEDSVLFCDFNNDILRDKLPSDLPVVYYNGGDVKGELLGLTPFVEMNYSYDGYTSPQIKTKIIGEYNYLNLLCAAAIGNYFGVNDEAIQAALMNYIPSNNRSQVVQTERDNTLILDAYNANPSSVSSALQSFAKMQSNGKGKVIILGDMLELGEESNVEHQKIVDQVKALGIEAYFVGPIYNALETSIDSFISKEEAVKYLENKELKQKHILLKGSRGIGLETLKEIL